jgi:hypothetical protein
MVRFSCLFASINKYGVVSGESVGVKNFSTDALRCALATFRNAMSALLAHGSVAPLTQMPQVVK